MTERNHIDRAQQQLVVGWSAPNQEQRHPYHRNPRAIVKLITQLGIYGVAR